MTSTLFLSLIDDHVASLSLLLKTRRFGHLEQGRLRDLRVAMEPTYNRTAIVNLRLPCRIISHERSGGDVVG